MSVVISYEDQANIIVIDIDDKFIVNVKACTLSEKLLNRHKMLLIFKQIISVLQKIMY